MGLKHCGKSTLGRLTADQFHIPFKDLDALLEAEHLNSTGEQLTFREIYNSRGKEYFQHLETKALTSFEKDYSDSAVILSLGGGTIENPEGMKLLKRFGTLIFLDLPADVLFKRIEQGGFPSFIDSQNPYPSFLELYNRRRPLYLKAANLTLTFDNQSIEECLSGLTNSLIEEKYVRQ